MTTHTKTQHTPGPWRITGPNIRSDHHADGPGALLLVAGGMFHDYTPDPDEQRANLALAASAPALADAAAQLLHEFDTWGEVLQSDTDGLYGPDTAIERLRSAHAAIAQARTS